MSLEDRNAQQDKIPVDKYDDPNADYEMNTRDYVMRPSADAVSGAIVITLPPVAQAKGRWYSIICRNADPVNTVTVTDNPGAGGLIGDSECWLGDIVFNGKCDRALLYSDGLAWLPAMGIGDWPGAVTTAPPGTATATTVGPTTAP